MKNMEFIRSVNAGLCVCLLLVLLMISGCRSSGKPKLVQAGPDPRTVDVRAMSRDLADLVNDYRRSKGLPALAWSDELSRLAQAHSEAMALRKRLSHDGFDGRFRNLARRGMVSRLTENVGFTMGQADPVRSVQQMWIDSSGHRRNMSGRDDSLTGVGAAVTADGYFYFTQLYGR